MSAKILGADYSPRHEGVLRTRAEWQVNIVQTIRAGGFRRVEADESGAVTYLHGPDGVIRHEIYANIPAPVGAEISLAGISL